MKTGAFRRPLVATILFCMVLSLCSFSPIKKANQHNYFQKVLELSKTSGKGAQSLAYDHFGATRNLLLFLTLSGIITQYVPYQPVIPVLGASSKDWNNKSFWSDGWGSSVMHKGIDIFHPIGTPIIASNAGLVIHTDSWKKGGNIIFILTADYKIHYYAHLDKILVNRFSFVSQGKVIGTSGETGNAKGKPPHLHFEIKRLIPDFSKADNDVQGYRKIWYDNPGLAFTNVR